MIEYENKQGCTIFHLNEDIDISNAFRIKEDIINTIDNEKITKIIFSFRKVKFIDSSGISIFIKIKSKYEKEVEIRLCNVFDTIRKSFEYSHLTDFLGLCETEQDAIDSLTK